MDTIEYTKEVARIATLKHIELAEYAHNEGILNNAVSTIRKNHKLSELQDIVFKHLSKQQKPVNMTSGTVQFINRYDKEVTASGLNKWIDGSNVVMARPTNKDGDYKNIFGRIETNDKTGMEQIRFYKPYLDTDGYIGMTVYGYTGFMDRDYFIKSMSENYKMSTSAINQFVDRYSEYLPTKDATKAKKKSTKNRDRY